MQINKYFSCQCGAFKGIKHKDLVCGYCKTGVILREKIEERNDSDFSLIWLILIYLAGKLVSLIEPENNIMSNTVQNGKGSKSRISNRKKFNENYSIIDWGKPKEEKPPQKIEDLKNKEILSFE